MTEKTIIVDGIEIDVIAHDSAFEMYLELQGGCTYQEYIANKNGNREDITFAYEDEINSLEDIEG